MSEHILTRKHKHHTHTHTAFGWRIHCGVEVTELSTNKQHTLFGACVSFQVCSVKFATAIPMNGSVHVESFNKNMKALGVLESKWNPIRQKLVRRFLEEQDKVLRSYFAQKGGTRGQRGRVTHGQGREHVKWDMYV